MRGLTRMIDLLIIFSITVAISYATLEKKTVSWEFKNNFMFYLVCLTFITLLILFLYVIPCLTKGATVGNLITKTKLETEDKLLIAIIKKEIIFSGS